MLHAGTPVNGLPPGSRLNALVTVGWVSQTMEGPSGVTETKEDLSWVSHAGACRQHRAGITGPMGQERRALAQLAGAQGWAHRGL